MNGSARTRIWLAGLAILVSIAGIMATLPAEVTACTVVGECRVTGGGNATAGIDFLGGWDGTLAEGKYRKGPGGLNRYTFGGQAGANTALEPQPEGEWTHHQQYGPDGEFVFHGFIINTIICGDPGWCSPAREAPSKQIDFGGVGVFRNIRNPSGSLLQVVPGVTEHRFDVHIEDLGEPGSRLKGVDLRDISCPPAGSAGEVADCGCPDFYRIQIYAADAPDEIIYTVYGYLDGGNFQIHPPTGFDLK